jgi:hypothetical protein
MKFLAHVFVGSDPFLQTLVSWGIGIVVLIISLGFWFMWWYLGKKNKS